MRPVFRPNPAVSGSQRSLFAESRLAVGYRYTPPNPKPRALALALAPQSILKELLDVLSAQSTNAHATRLEMIIVYLIFVEVAIELVWNVIIKDIFRLVGEDLRDC